MDLTLRLPSGDDLNEGEVAFYEFKASSEKITLKAVATTRTLGLNT